MTPQQAWFRANGKPLRAPSPTPLSVVVVCLEPAAPVKVAPDGTVPVATNGSHSPCPNHPRHPLPASKRHLLRPRRPSLQKDQTLLLLRYGPSPNPPPLPRLCAILMFHTFAVLMFRKSATLKGTRHWGRSGFEPGRVCGMRRGWRRRRRMRWRCWIGRGGSMVGGGRRSRIAGRETGQPVNLSAS